jgi:putative glutamine amidotransferase
MSLDKIKVYHANQNYNYSNWIPCSTPWGNIGECDLILFEGGEDIHPLIYGDVVGEFTYTNIDRDIKEVALFKKALDLKKPILGICRGAQLACALSGGKIIQHQENKMKEHSVLTLQGSIMMSSYHHQAQYPYVLSSKDYQLLGWTYCLSAFHLDGKGKEMTHTELYPEAEIVYYSKTNALGIQGHPEMLFREKSKYGKTFEVLENIMDKFLNKKL